MTDPIVLCERCERLRLWCARVAREKVRRFADEEYWGRPVPAFGGLDSRLLVVGLAPGAHGANRTGRLFTGDRSGDWLFRAMFAQGFCTSPDSVSRFDGLATIDCRITAIVHCAPPDNKPTTREIRNCGSYLRDELVAMPRLRVMIALGSLAYRELCRALAAAIDERPPKFRHSGTLRLRDGRLIIASYHPSQQNTFTGRLTMPMLEAVFAAARSELQGADGDAITTPPNAVN